MKAKIENLIEALENIVEENQQIGKLINRKIKEKIQ